MAEWIAEVRFTAAVAAKIKSKHDLTEDMVREAVCFGAADQARWHDHEQHGRRLLVVGSPYGTSGRLMAILMPVDRQEGVWQCKTAIPWP